MVLESGVLPPPLQLYAAAAAHLAPRPPWAPLLQFPGAAQLLGQFPGAFSPLSRPRYPHGLGPGLRAPPGPPSEDSGSELNGKGRFFTWGLVFEWVLVAVLGIFQRLVHEMIKKDSVYVFTY